MTIGLSGLLSSDTDGGSPNNGLSGFPSSTFIFGSLSTTIDVVDPSFPRTIFTDADQIGEDFTGKWFLFQTNSTTNTNDQVARKIEAFNTITGEFTLVSDMPEDLVIGDRYTVYGAGRVFDDFTFDQTQRDISKVRLIWMRNSTGSAFQNYSMYVVPIDPGPLVMEVAQGDNDLTNLSVAGVTNEEDDPDLSSLSNFIQDGSAIGTERFSNAKSVAVGLLKSPLSFSTLSINRLIPTFIRISLREGEPMPLAAEAVFQIFFAEAPPEALPKLSSALIIINVPGPNEEFILGPDRAARLGAGVRVEAIVRDADTGILIPGKTITIEKTSGPGTMIDIIQEVSDGVTPVQTPYFSPTDSGQVGATVIFNIEVN